MSDFLRSWLTLVIFGALAVILVGVFLGIGSLLRPQRETPQKVINYESGVTLREIGGVRPIFVITYLL